MIADFGTTTFLAFRFGAAFGTVFDATGTAFLFCPVFAFGTVFDATGGAAALDAADGVTVTESALDATDGVTVTAAVDATDGVNGGTATGVPLVDGEICSLVGAN